MTHTRTTETLTLAGAQAALTASINQATSLGVAVVMTVVDPGGNVIASARMDGAPLLSIGVAADKAWSVMAFGAPTHWWADAVAADPDLRALTQGRPLLPVPGGVAITTGGALVGAIGVSGATAEQDRAIAEAGAAAVGT